MSRLYLRIFLSFWVVIILTVSAVLVINTKLESAQQDDIELSGRAQRVAEGMGQRGQQALDRGGPEGLGHWAEGGPQHGRRILIYVLDSSGGEVLERRPPLEIRRLGRDWQRSGQVPEAVRRGQFIAELSNPEYGRYLVVLTPPQRPVVLRLFGPLGTGGLIGLAVLISGLVCLWLAQSITRPLRELRLTGQALGRGELTARVATATSGRGDELGDLARDFNRMAERLEQLIQTQRQLFRDVSHELRSPLARLQVALVLSADSTDDNRRRSYLARMETDLERLNSLIGEILGYARLSQQPELKRQPIELGELLDDIAESARLEGQARNIGVSLEAPSSLPLIGDPELLLRALENVVRNALRHAPEGTEVAIKAQQDNDRITITISDQGPGVPAERLDDIFQPFVRLSEERSESGGGGGIGLAIARAAVELHGGLVRAVKSPRGGLEVRLELPLDTSLQNE